MYININSNIIQFNIGKNNQKNVGVIRYNNEEFKKTKYLGLQSI